MGRRSSRSLRRRPRSAVRRPAGGGAARRSARDGRRGASRRSDRSRCSRRSAGPRPVGRAVPASSRAGCRATRAPRGAAEPAVVRRRRRGPPSQARAGARLVRDGRPGTVVHDPYAIVRPRMQTTLARRQRHRRAVSRRRRGSGGTAVRRILIAIPIILLLLSVLLAGAGALFTVAAYNYYATGLPDPKLGAQRPQLRAADDRLRPHRQGRAGAARDAAARDRDVRPDPARDARCDDRRSRTRISGRTRASTPSASSAPAWTPFGHGHEAPRRSPSSSSARGCSLRRPSRAARRAQGPRDHPVDPPDRGVPR